MNFPAPRHCLHVFGIAPLRVAEDGSCHREGRAAPPAGLAEVETLRGSGLVAFCSRVPLYLCLSLDPPCRVMARSRVAQRARAAGVQGPAIQDQIQAAACVRMTEGHPRSHVWPSPGSAMCSASCKVLALTQLVPRDRRLRLLFRTYTLLSQEPMEEGAGLHLLLARPVFF